MGDTPDLIKESMAVFTGCKIRKDINGYNITSATKDELMITDTTKIQLRLPNGDGRKSLQW